MIGCTQCWFSTHRVKLWVVGARTWSILSEGVQAGLRFHTLVRPPRSAPPRDCNN